MKDNYQEPKPNNVEIQRSFSNIYDFQKAYPRKADREEALRKMSNEQIDKLIATAGIVQGKIYLASFKK